MFILSLFNEVYAISWVPIETNISNSISHFTISVPSNWELNRVDESEMISRGVIDVDYNTLLQRILVVTVAKPPNFNDLNFPDFNNLTIQERNELAHMLIRFFTIGVNTNNYDLYSSKSTNINNNAAVQILFGSTYNINNNVIYSHQQLNVFPYVKQISKNKKELRLVLLHCHYANYLSNKSDIIYQFIEEYNSLCLNFINSFDLHDK
jgi:hypothetical protein